MRQSSRPTRAEKWLPQINPLPINPRLIRLLGAVSPAVAARRNWGATAQARIPAIPFLIAARRVKPVACEADFFSNELMGIEEGICRRESSWIKDEVGKFLG